jgi:pyruvate carboxylase
MQVVEIAPAPSLAQSIKDALYADAVKLAKHVGYRNAGQQPQQQQQQGRLVKLSHAARLSSTESSW